MRLSGPLLLVAVLTILSACVIACGSADPSPSTGPDLSLDERRYRLVDEVGRPAFCDPDLYPVARDELAAMNERFAAIEADRPRFELIATRLGIALAGRLTDEARLAIYRDAKLLDTVTIDAATGAFEVLIDVDAADVGTRIRGTIAGDGTIRIDGRDPGAMLQCPICLAAGTRIATPAGEIAVESVSAGTTIWTLDEEGRRVRGIVERTARAPAPADHHVVRLELADGRVLTASVGHPLVDGRRLGDLFVGDVVDGAAVMAATTLPYDVGWTYDLEVSGGTGAYLADGVWLASTLSP